MIRLSDLCGKKVRREGGEVLGRVHEVHIENSRVTTLVCGGGGYWQRLTASHVGKRVPWEHVVRVSATEIVVEDKR